ncbi:hypothetical protein [Streptomyces durhamensis]|uniref:hypothetical protein n=1 Tax=Streptomyces durhamensis TaxID=68194 RepID=UPI0004CD2B52|nr:hypothetical protein [Streptomyces durhamensis]
MEDKNEPSTTWNITGSQDFIAGSQQNFIQNNVHNAGFKPEDVAKLAELIRRNGDLLGLSESQRDELIQDADILEDEATSTSPDESKIRAIGRRIKGLLVSAPSDSMVQQMLLSAFDQGMGSVLGS